MAGNDDYHEDGAFARYVMSKGEMLMHMPDDVGFDAAATVSVGVATLGYGLYRVLALPLPDEEVKHSGQTVLVYGGSTASGSLAIQFAKMQVRPVALVPGRFC